MLKFNHCHHFKDGITLETKFNKFSKTNSLVQKPEGIYTINLTLPTKDVPAILNKMREIEFAIEKRCNAKGLTSALKNNCLRVDCSY